MPAEAHSQIEDSAAKTIAVPAPTAWPIVMAFGVTLLFAGLATTVGVSIVGGIAAVTGAVGWFRAVLPREEHEELATEPGPPSPATARREVVRFHVARDARRAWLPVETYPISAGVKGGIAGGIAMAIVAGIYGIVSGTSVWYPINLLAAGFYPEGVMQTTAQISRFQPGAFAIACVIHGLGSLLVGLLYGALLPIFPRRPILLAGFAIPVIWVALFHSFIGLINPVLNERLDWKSFILAQFVFGIVAGLVVTRQGKIRTWQGAPFAIRAGLEASGLEHDRGEEEKR